MPEEFEDRDLTEAVFWGVDLTRAHLRDVDLTGVTIRNGRLVDVDIDGVVERLTVNGVDVTAFVNERDRWFPLRTMLCPADAAGMLAAWDALERAWTGPLDLAATLSEAQRRTSVDGEWSLVDTLRHLVFAIDKWFTVPVLGAPSFHPVGIPNSGSAHLEWPGLDPGADPTFDEVVAVRAERARELRRFLDAVGRDGAAAELDRTVEVLENGSAVVRDCIRVVLEEEFGHLRYAERDLARLA